MKIICKRRAATLLKAKKPVITTKTLRKEFETAMKYRSTSLNVSFYEKFSDATKDIGFNSNEIGVDVNSPTIYAKGRGFTVYHFDSRQWLLYDLSSIGEYTSKNGNQYYYYTSRMNIAINDLLRLVRYSDKTLARNRANSLARKKAKWVLDKKIEHELKNSYVTKVDILIGHIDSTTEIVSPNAKAEMRVRLTFSTQGKQRVGTYAIDFENEKFTHISGAESKSFGNEKEVFSEIAKVV